MIQFNNLAFVKLIQFKHSAHVKLLLLYVCLQFTDAELCSKFKPGYSQAKKDAVIKYFKHKTDLMFQDDILEPLKRHEGNGILLQVGKD